MRSERARRTEIVKRLPDAYPAQKKAKKHQQEIQEKKSHASDLFKFQALLMSESQQCHFLLPRTHAVRASLVVRKQNATAFHSSTSSFCAMANQPMPKLVNLPTIADIPSDCLAPPAPSTMEQTQNVSAPHLSHQGGNSQEDEESADGENWSATTII